MRRRDFLVRTSQSAAAFGIARQLGACRPSGGAAGSSLFVSTRDRYFIQFLQLNPVVSTYLGGDGYSPALATVNGKLRDFRPEALDRERAFYQTMRRELSRMD